MNDLFSEDDNWQNGIDPLLDPTKQKRKEWENPIPYPDKPDYSRVEALQKQLDSLDSGIAPYLPMQGFQQQQERRRQQIMSLMNNEARRAEMDYAARLNNYTRMEGQRPKYKMMSQPIVDQEGNISYVGQLGDEEPRRFNLGKGQTPGMSIADTNAARYNARTAALKEKWAADRQIKESQFQQAEAGRNSRANLTQTGLNSRFNRGLAYRQAPVDPADKMQWQDLRDEEDDAQHALLQAEKYQDQDLIARQTHRLAIVNQKQNALLAKVKGAPKAPSAATPPTTSPTNAPSAAPTPSASIPPEVQASAANAQEGQYIKLADGRAWQKRNGQLVQVR